MQINAVKFRLNQNDEPITYKFSQSSGKYANFQSICGSPGLLKNIKNAIDFALTGNMAATIFDAVLQTSDHAGNTWIVHRTLSKVRLVRNGSELAADQMGELHASFLEHIDEPASRAGGERFIINAKKIIFSKGKLLSITDGVETSGGDVRNVLEDQITAITKACVENTGLIQLADPAILIKIAQKIEPVFNSYREICEQYRNVKDKKSVDPEAGSSEIHALKGQLDIIRELELVADKFLAPNFSISKASEDIAVIESNIAEISGALNINRADAAGLIKDFRKPIEALARLEMFAKLVRASQGSRKYCEQKIEPLFKKYLDFADRNLANNRQISGELDSCLSTLALRMKPENPPVRESGQSLKTWFEKFKNKAGNDPLQSVDSAQNDFDTARLAVEYAISQLNEMSGHLKIAVSKHDSALVAVDESHESLVAQYNQLRTHWIATAKTSGIPTDIDSTHMIKIIVAHGRLAGLIERRNQLEVTRKQQESDLVQIEDLIVRWRAATGSQKSLDLSSSSIILREARDILRYKEARVRRRDQLKAQKDTASGSKAVLDHLKERREAIVAQWDESFASFGIDTPSISDKYNRELLKRAAIVRGLTLAWAATPGFDEGSVPFHADASKAAIEVCDTSEMKFDQNARLEFLGHIESARGEEMKLLLISDEPLHSLVTAMAIGTATRVVQAPAPAAPQPGRPTPVAKIIRADKKPRTRSSQELLSDRAQQMLDILSPRR